MEFVEILRYAQVALGIGAVIFVHEAGHFFAARFCGVRVRVFSLGFGPKMIGFQRGGTLYQIAWVPLGGYVLMAGEENENGDLPPAPDELRAKSVGQRFLIYSGGVIMNVVFALIAFPFVLTSGVPFIEPVVGRAMPGGPAWKADIPAGSRVLSVNGKETIAFMNIGSEIALGSENGVTLEILEPGATAPRTLTLQAEYSGGAGYHSIDIIPPFDAQGTIRVEKGSPAWEAGLRTGDAIVGVVDGFADVELARQLELEMEQGHELVLSIVDGENGGARDVRVPPVSGQGAGRPLLGVGLPVDLVVDLRSSPALEALGLLEGDRILRANDRPLYLQGDFLRALASRVGEPLTLRVAREGRELELAGPALSRAEAIDLASDVALRQDVDTLALVVSPGSPAERCGLESGDVVLRIDGVDIPDWSAFTQLTKEAGRSGVPMNFTVERVGDAGGIALVKLDVAPGEWSRPTYGFALRQSYYTYRTENVGQAVTVGVRASWKFLVDTWLTLKRIVQGRVSGDNVGGIITIGRVSYSWASLGWEKLVFFLCMLSINLAFLNVLPIPVLDGGHLFFLMVEKVKGSPVSEKVLGYSQMVGFVLILSLMIYVTYNDIVRWFPDLFGS